jgi:hypothetical protein
MVLKLVPFVSSDRSEIVQGDWRLLALLFASVRGGVAVSMFVWPTTKLSRRGR